ncbi:MAG TPA: nuclear transport factor 2 family protein [Pyrinomonadaceae bacterium]|jgi:limonene-1,2-epoxide hydrolase|nr:nuclear transport factor 2 family protein [Pyrinomonadaceae bacterium]
MSEQVAQNFIAALGKLEAERDLDTIVALFADDAEIGNIVAPEKFHGPDGAREFWGKYRETFGEMKSTFRNRIIGENRAALEWHTTGTAANGDGDDAQIEYEGVSILEIDGDRITRFRAYFNAGDLGRQITGEKS